MVLNIGQINQQIETLKNEQIEHIDKLKTNDDDKLTKELTVLNSLIMNYLKLKNIMNSEKK
jgi:hypothetical protein